MVITPSQSELWSVGRLICRQFELGRVRKIDALLHQGYSNFNARIETEQGIYVLRRYAEQSPEKITYELHLIEWLVSQGFPVVPPLRDPGGRARYTLGKEHPASWVIFPFVNGAPPELIPATAHEMGTLAARLHQLPEGIPEAGKRENLLSVPATLEIAESLRKAGTKTARRFLHMTEHLATEVQDVSLPAGLVHGDLFPDNTIFHAGRLAAVLDWEEACVDTYLFDIAMAMHGFSYRSEEWCPGLARSFLSGYENLRPLGSDEREALPLFLAWTPIALAGWHLRRYSLAPGPRQARRIEQLLIRGETLFDCGKLFH